MYAIYYIYPGKAKPFLSCFLVKHPVEIYYKNDLIK